MITPESKFIHIVRDGLDVASSIDSLIKENSYRMAFRKNFNLWWGESENKWKMLQQDGAASGYFPEEVAFLQTNFEKGIYEWLISLGEVDKYRKQLGERLLEIRYTDLINSPSQTLALLADFLGISNDSRWLDKSVSWLIPEKSRNREVELPPKMCAAFNKYQDRYGFKGRAKPVNIEIHKEE